jgi:hypothetical protein
LAIKGRCKWGSNGQQAKINGSSMEAQLTRTEAFAHLENILRWLRVGYPDVGGSQTGLSVGESNFSTFKVEVAEVDEVGDADMGLPPEPIRRRLGPGLDWCLGIGRFGPPPYSGSQASGWTPLIQRRGIIVQ